MSLKNDFDVWIENNLLDFIEDPILSGEGVYDTPFGRMLLVDSQDSLFNRKMDFVPPKETDAVLESVGNTNNPIKYFIYFFGGNFFYTPVDSSEMNLLRYIGDSFKEVKVDAAFLGVHGRYEQMNGTRDYKDWCIKAKFLGYTSLGLCEKGTLAGTLPFQLACQKAKIKPILGETFSVIYHGENGDSKFEVKLYAMNQKGWKNLLALHTIHSIVNSGYISTLDLLAKKEGLICVIVPCRITATTILSETIQKLFHPKHRFFQLTTNEFESEAKDVELLDAMKWFLEEGEISPIILSDAYVLDYEDVHIKKVLNQCVSNFTPNMKNHYLRGVDELFFELESLFSSNDKRLFSVFKEAIKNTKVLSDEVTFAIDLDSLHLPKYEMTKEEEEIFLSNEDLFLHIIEERRKSIALEGKYSDNLLKQRVDLEIDVIRRGGFIDYFLILWDIINWCGKQSPPILTGIGRGSAGGSLVSYCMGITLMNPLDYDLLFERFLNAGRMGTIEEKPILIIETEKEEINLDFDQKVQIIRKGERIRGYAKEIQKGDSLEKIGWFSS